MERIFIVGYMGSGKTTVGKQLAKEMSLCFVDLDAYIENKYRMTVNTIFSEKGEEGFRKIESHVLQEISEFEDVVISTGGGTPCFFDNMEVMNRTGTTIYLEANPEDLACHLLASKIIRPLIAGKPREELIPFITSHLAKREQYYNQAQIIFHTDRMLTKDAISFTVKGLKEKIMRRDSK